MIGVASFRVEPYELPLIRGWPGMDSRKGMIVSLEAVDGTTGSGDCAPLPSHGTESLEAAADFLNSFLQPGPLPMLMTGLRDKSGRFPAACLAVECACLDLLSKARGLALRRYLAPSATNHVRTNAAIGGVDDGLEERAGAALQEGFTILKLKTGAFDEFERIEALAAILPQGSRLRIDAGGRWTRDEAVKAIGRLNLLPIDGLEEPCKGADLESLAGLQARASFPIALDETIGLVGWEAAVQSRAIRRLIIKPPAIGGMVQAIHYARAARAAGMEVVVTSAMDSAIGVVAAAQLAAAVDTLFPAGEAPTHGLATSVWLARDLARIMEAEAGFLPLPSTFGLGVTPSF